MNSKTKRKGFGRIVFITGTDTGVGKTVFTGLLLHHLRAQGCYALAMKPFCSGGRDDVELLHALQDGELREDEINPFYFSEPVAPLVSLRRRHRMIPLTDVLRHIRRIATRCECLLIEGSGGLLVPLGANYFVSDVISKLNCEVVIVARNRLGTINHTLLTVEALRRRGVRAMRIILMTSGRKDRSSMTNGKILGELLAPIEVCVIDFLGQNAAELRALKNNCKKVKKTLARFCS